ncbi:MAG: bifunctional oligoribonuclease/PAP phosphatase NrnA [Acholeplasmatales bacterium]|jgi:phosphoesterase RecJ-like protein|nr:bifunctional oligoribonuclease/PAP phosphatase NrnA [Acholeplasmatales bacterium]
MIKELAKKVISTIKKYDTITIFGHIRPDGDCYGSQFGLKNIIKTTFPDKKVYVLTDKCLYVSFLGKTDILDDDVIKNSLAIVVDTGSIDRVSDLRFQTAKEIIKLDHHIVNDEYGYFGTNINYIEDEKPATCQILTEFLLQFKELKISKEGAIALYTGIITDTGGFRYRGVDSTTLKCAAYLIDKGVDVEYIATMLGTRSYESLLFEGYVINNLVRDGGLVYCVLRKDIIEKYNVTYEDASNMISVYSGLENCPIWFLVIENKDLSIRLRIRSNKINLIELSNKYEGGGHEFATGAKLKDWSKLKEFVKDAKSFL